MSSQCVSSFLIVHLDEVEPRFACRKFGLVSVDGMGEKRGVGADTHVFPYGMLFGFKRAKEKLRSPFLRGLQNYVANIIYRCILAWIADVLLA